MVQSVKRTFDILNALGNLKNKSSLAEISEYVNLPPSTVHRLLTTLKDANFVSQEEGTNKYYLGPALISLGIEASNYLDIRKAAYPILLHLAEETKEDAYLSMIDGYYGIIIESVAGPHPLKIIGLPQSRVPLHAGAARKILLAFQTDEFINEYISHQLKQVTENTIIKPHELKEHLQNIKKQGFATSVGEHLIDATGISAPVFDRMGKLVGGMGIIGPSIRMKPDKDLNLITSVKKHALELSLSLGYQPMINYL